MRLILAQVSRFTTDTISRAAINTFFPTCRQALRVCTRLTPIRLCMMGVDASRRQQVAPHLRLSLWLGQCCAAPSLKLTQTCVCKRVCGCVFVHCVFMCGAVGYAGLRLIGVCDCVRRAVRECCNINLLGTESAACWHLPLFHADNVKYLSTGVCGHPANQGKPGLLIHK